MGVPAPRAAAPAPKPAAGWERLDNPANFLRSKDSREFKELILEIRQAEEEMERQNREPRV